jgi:hypothetical protein
MLNGSIRVENRRSTSDLQARLVTQFENDIGVNHTALCGMIPELSAGRDEANLGFRV